MGQSWVTYYNQGVIEDYSLLQPLNSLIELRGELDCHKDHNHHVTLAAYNN